MVFDLNSNIHQAIRKQTTQTTSGPQGSITE